MVWEGVCSGAEGARTDLIGRILTAENRKWKREPDLRSNIFQRKRDQLSVVSVKLGFESARNFYSKFRKSNIYIYIHFI